MKRIYHVSAFRRLDDLRQHWHGLLQADPPAGDLNQWYNELLQGVTAQLDLQLQRSQLGGFEQLGVVVIDSLTDLGAERHAPAVDTRNP